MRRFLAFVRLLRSLAGRGPVDRDLDQEMASCLEMIADEKIASGMPAAEARRQARLEMGGVEQAKESVRAARPGAWLDTFARDARHSVRLLVKTPAFSAAAIVTLALGIGANVAAFGLVNVLLLRPLTGSDAPGQMVGVHSHDPRTGSYRWFSYAEYEEVRDRARIFTSVMAHNRTAASFSDGETTRRAAIGEITGSYFTTLGVRLAAGRSFSADEERPGSGAALAVVSHDTWLALGGDAGVLGRTIFLNSHPFTIVGIAPAGFSGTMVAFGPVVWIPLGADRLLSDETSVERNAISPRDLAQRNLLVVGRLGPNLSVAAASAALDVVSRQLERDDPSGGGGHVLTVSRLARTEQGPGPRDDSDLIAPLGTLGGMAALLLVVAGLNVANMHLARGSNRRKEIAMRLALGAGRLRIVCQLLTEALLLALAGGVAGLILGVWILRLVVVSLSPLTDQSVAVSVAPDGRVVAAMVGFSAIAAAIFALVPSWTLSRMDLGGEVKGGTREAGGGDARRMGSRHLLVAGQMALSLALLAAAGLFVRAAVAAGHADPGYRLDGQLVARVDATGRGEVTGRQAYAGLMERLRAMPEVDSAAISSQLAFSSQSSTREVRKASGADITGLHAAQAGVVALDYAVGTAYFHTLGLRLIRGREFTLAEEQQPGSARVAIVDEPLARALFEGDDPIGRYVELMPDPEAGSTAAETLEIVGLAPGLRQHLTDQAPVHHVYLPLGSHYQPRLNIHVRLSVGGRAEPAEMLRRLRRTIRMADARLAILGVSTLEQARDASPTSWLIRTAGQAFGVLGAIAVAMAVVGLYGVKAYLVARRTREIGIRMALGATPGGVVCMVLKEGSLLVAAGVLVGFLLALAAGRIVGGMLTGVHPLDPLVLLVATSVLTLAVAAASFLPARRATRVDPAVALRTE